jgi:multicomponent Na+:H+ antiporter subunit C
MELYMAIVVGVLFAAGTYLILRPNLIRIVLGMGLYSNAVNLLMITCGGYNQKLAAPFAPKGADTAALMDPLPPDIILTAIVISFAVGALFLTICYRVYLDHGTDNPSLLPNHDPADAAMPPAAGQATPSLATDPDDLVEPDKPHLNEPAFDPLAELAQPNPNAPHERVPGKAAKGH